MSQNDRQDAIFRALADPTRRQLLDLLREHPLTTGQLCEELTGLDRCTVMQHLGVLERAGLVLARKEGRHRWNYLNAVPIQRIYDRWISRYARPSVELLDRLERDLGSTVRPGVPLPQSSSWGAGART